MNWPLELLQSAEVWQVIKVTQVSSYSEVIIESYKPTA